MNDENKDGEYCVDKKRIKRKKSSEKNEETQGRSSATE